MLWSRRNLEWRHSDCWYSRIGKVVCIRIFPRRLNAKEVLITHQKGEFVFPVANGSAKLSGRNYESNNPLWDGSTPWGENLSGESQGEREEFQLEETKDDEEIHKDFGGQELEKIFIYRHHVEPRSSILRAEKRIISYSTEFFWCH